MSEREIPLWKLIAFGRVQGCIQWHQVPSFVRKQPWRLIQEAKTVVERHACETDNVRYQYACNAAMCCVMGGEYIRAEENVLLSRKVDDSPCAWKLPLCPEDIDKKRKKRESTAWKKYSQTIVVIESYCSLDIRSGEAVNRGKRLSRNSL